MLLIEAIIQPDRLEAVQQALEDAGVPGIIVTDVMGCGRQKGHKVVYHGAEYAFTFRHKIKIEAVVHPADQASVVQAITSAARTGRIGDGKIFILPVSDAVRIRDGAINEAAL